VIAQATDLPVNADLENGYADDPSYFPAQKYWPNLLM
jgi:2-methylisocitrate lyase-like PEP mutase family enzyme